jgi:hypothetical protein
MRHHGVEVVGDESAKTFPITTRGSDLGSGRQRLDRKYDKAKQDCDESTIHCSSGTTEYTRRTLYSDSRTLDQFISKQDCRPVGQQIFKGFGE